jgi:hypothetical protein
MEWEYKDYLEWAERGYQYQDITNSMKLFLFSFESQPNYTKLMKINPTEKVKKNHHEFDDVSRNGGCFYIVRGPTGVIRIVKLALDMGNEVYLMFNGEPSRFYKLDEEYDINFMKRTCPDLINYFEFCTFMTSKSC